MQERYIAFVKKLTSKPVVGVGRFTSPDAMVSQVKRGILDFIGAARPSIADPFLPRKIDEGREDEIRECIGCNICRAHNNEGVPIRCTQNPTMGEEWRRGWHPERVQPAKSSREVRAGGRRRAGRAGMRADPGQARLSRAAGRGGTRARRADQLGIAAAGPCLLWPGARLAPGPHRRLPNVEIYRESRLTAADVARVRHSRQCDRDRCRWRRDGVGHSTSDGHPGAGIAWRADAR